MLYFIAIAACVLLVLFVAIPLIKTMFQALLAFLGNLFGVVIGIALLVGAIILCIAFPPLLLPIGIFAVYSLSKGKQKAGPQSPGK
ncbi:hypothetical protein [Salinivibrio sp. IB643]|uniref:hypothetical protein n=1 Tax=Salinivibrio sp. IB643 TaxID=1909445 RepID=UPI0009890C46|nr:hypothetical protein [Salinivibrio sp. IB643]OOE94570.1 hypothetical protein BZG77_14145 [Salinivibrio sp. IB643]